MLHSIVDQANGELDGTLLSDDPAVWIASVDSITIAETLVWKLPTEPKTFRDYVYAELQEWERNKFLTITWFPQNNRLRFLEASDTIILDAFHSSETVCTK